MYVVSEEIVRQVISVEDAIDTVRKVFAALGRQNAENYPVVREFLGMGDAVFGIKSGFDSEGKVLGLKAGGYWPGNIARGLSNHQSSVLLFDHETGCTRAVVSANYLTGIRTGAASALAAKYLACPDAKILGIIGAGAQAIFQIQAMKTLFSLKKVIAFDISPERLQSLEQKINSMGLSFESADAHSVASGADVLVTVTPAKAPIIESEWVHEGTHINAMGADTKGKQELPTELIEKSNVYVDSVEQAISIGECQHAYQKGLLKHSAIKGTLSELINGTVSGRESSAEITIFDGTGIALQDIAVAELALRLSVEKGLVIEHKY